MFRTSKLEKSEKQAKNFYLKETVSSKEWVNMFSQEAALECGSLFVLKSSLMISCAYFIFANKEFFVMSAFFFIPMSSCSDTFNLPFLNYFKLK